MLNWNRRVWALCAALVMSMTAAWGCSDDQVAGSTTCSADADCSLGQVCDFQNTCITTSNCDFCTPDQVCLKTADDPDGSCSAPECAGDADCASKPGTTCQGGLCVSGGSATCTNDDDCEAGQTCNLAGECEAAAACEGDGDCEAGKICQDSACVAGCNATQACPEGEVCNAGQCEEATTCTPGSCEAGQYCDTATMQCAPITSCDQVTCDAGLFCNPTTFACEAGCTADSCEAGKVCDPQTGQCVADNCFGEDPAQCTGNVERPIWDPVKCFCAECLSDSDCDTAAGETCNAGGQCFACETACDSNTPGTCGDGTPYCINDCCVECVGAADCGQGQVCLDGFCSEPPNCAQDPTVCPTGYTCDQASGECQAPNTNQQCDIQDPTSCPQGTFCDPSTGTCSGAGGGLGCGLCNADCTCPNGTCNGFACECSTPFSTDECPADTACLPLINMCLPPLF